MVDNFVGKQIGNYRLVEKVGRGTFGSVYIAKHHIFEDEDEPIVAVKLLHAHHNVQEQYKEFLQEARIQRKLKHPHILPVLEAGMYEDSYYLILEYAPNKSLRDLLHRYPSKPIPTDQAIMILSQIGQALQYAHERNIVHRDLKPENILFNANDEALLADFSIAVVLERTQLVDGSGTPAYMAPEQFEKIVSHRSDQYALACIAYELLTGRRPFEADNVVAMGLKHKTEPVIPPRQLNPNLPLHIEQAILTAMAKDHKKRYENVSRFIEALQMSSEEWKIEGDLYYHASRHEDALGAYERAIQLDSSNASAYCGKGNILCVLKRYEEALAEYERALQRDPDYAAAYYGKGNALVEKMSRPFFVSSHHRSTEALMAYERALQLGFSKVLVHCGKGKVFCILGSYHEALASYEWVLQCDPNAAAAYCGKGRALYGLKSYEEALAAYEQALQLDHEDVDAHNGKLSVLRDLKHYEEALEICEQIIQLDREDTQVYVSKGEMLYHLKRYKDALAAYEKALQIDGNSTNVLRSKYQTLIQLERYEEALRFFKANHTLSIRTYSQDTHHLQALVAAKESLLYNSRDAHAYTDKADALYFLNFYEEALAAHEQAIQINPGYVPAFYGMGRVLRRLERYEKALNAYDQVIRLEPNHHSIYKDKGDILEQLGRSEEARQAHLKHSELNPPIQFQFE